MEAKNNSVFARIECKDRIDIEAKAISCDVAEEYSCFGDEASRVTVTLVFRRQPTQGLFLSPRDKAEYEVSKTEVL